MTKKLAIFVEGQTEQIFVQQLLSEIAGAKNVHFDVLQMSQNGTIRLLTLSNRSISQKYSVLIFDCQNDEKVKSVILEHRPALVSKGYSLILGIRDLYPSPLSDLQLIKSRLQYGVPTSEPRTRILLAVSEVEAWFLQEKTHFNKVDGALNHSEFKSKFGFDPEVDSAEDVHQPSSLLHDIYQSVNKAYRKSRKHVQRTVDAIDFNELCLTSSQRLPHFQILMGDLDSFLT